MSFSMNVSSPEELTAEIEQTVQPVPEEEAKLQEEARCERRDDHGAGCRVAGAAQRDPCNRSMRSG